MSHPVSPAQRRMDALRSRAALASRCWLLSADGRISITAGPNEAAQVRIAEIPADAPFVDQDFLCHAPDDLIWLLERYDGLAERYRAMKAERDAEEKRREAKRPKQPDHAAECAMKCAEPAFRVYLEKCQGLERPLTEIRVATKVRSILDIKSRGDLNRDEAAAGRWKKLRADFEAWRRKP